MKSNLWARVSSQLPSPDPIELRYMRPSIVANGPRTMVEDENPRYMENLLLTSTLKLFDETLDLFPCMAYSYDETLKMLTLT